MHLLQMSTLKRQKRQLVFSYFDFSKNNFKLNCL
jgi:hypothetical protein